MLTEAQVTELKAKHGDALQCVDTPKGPFVFKKPSRSAFDKWHDGLRDPSHSRSALARELAQSCLVSPEYGDFLELINEYPGILGGEILEACTTGIGLTEKFEVKKL